MAQDCPGGRTGEIGRHGVEELIAWPRDEHEADNAQDDESWGCSANKYVCRRRASRLPATTCILLTRLGRSGLMHDTTCRCLEHLFSRRSCEAREAQDALHYAPLRTLWTESWRHIEVRPRIDERGFGLVSEIGAFAQVLVLAPGS
ncbi:uncharacterized protein UV8b_04672 [Ustilaginoidea virens]|uniref:Uncharacterized protein n=1 Tax=Ustilaginoidea virens TaxID=1159556 RepID=A0A8E5MHY1_USTVR|nr:uncharacterized protein UV8b_04672 [Ustilaginoidea virens]QUC20431.1 hypothetical protein UV8b_04672 [Ustilaginoidea virens]